MIFFGHFGVIYIFLMDSISHCISVWIYTQHIEYVFIFHLQKCWILHILCSKLLSSRSRAVSDPSWHILSCFITYMSLNCHPQVTTQLLWGLRLWLAIQELLIQSLLSWLGCVPQLISLGKKQIRLLHPGVVSFSRPFLDLAAFLFPSILTSSALEQLWKRSVHSWSPPCS